MQGPRTAAGAADAVGRIGKGKAVTVQRKPSALGGLGRWLSYFRREGGNIAPLMALLLVPLIGALSMGVEASSWFFVSRAAQNAADSAAVAAANNGVLTNVGGYPQYEWEGWANTRKYGFTNGANNVTVNVVNGQTCPDGANACYRATVTKIVPIYLTRIIGFNGDTALGSGRGKTIVSTALAEPIDAISFPSCITAIGSDSATPKKNQSAISGDGTPDANAPGCSLSAVGAAPSSIECTGSQGLGAAYAFATGSISGSGNHTCVEQSTVNSSFTFCDPYSASPTSGCPATSYDVQGAVNSASSTNCSMSSGKLVAVTSSCTHSGTVTLGGPISGPSTGAVVVITNGDLNMAGYSSTNVTYVFNGTSPGTLSSGVSVDLTAPSDPNFSLHGIAAYQISSNACTRNMCDTWDETGNYTVDVTGLLYLPYTNANFGGSAGQSSAGNCFISVFNSFATNGTGYVLDQAGCKAAGLDDLPTVQRYRAALVQ